MKRLLRELFITLDVLLGGDYRQYGHLPPLADREPPTLPPPKPDESPFTAAHTVEIDGEGYR